MFDLSILFHDDRGLGVVPSRVWEVLVACTANTSRVALDKPCFPSFYYFYSRCASCQIMIHQHSRECQDTLCTFGLFAVSVRTFAPILSALLLCHLMSSRSMTKCAMLTRTPSFVSKPSYYPRAVAKEDDEESPNFPDFLRPGARDAVS